MKKVIIFLAFAVLAVLLIKPIENNDVWMHIKTGECMVNNMRLARVDDYSYTQEGKKWLNHQWLSQVIFYLSYKRLGVNGPIALQFIFAFFAFVLLFKAAYNKNKWLLSVFLMFLIILFSQDGLVARPLVISLFLFSVFIFILHKYKYEWDSQKANLVYALIPLQILWINLHAAAIMGVFLIWAHAAGEFIDIYVRKGLKSDFVMRKDKYRKLLYAAGLITLSIGLTPWGYDAILFPIKEVKSMYYILEWFPSVQGDIFLNRGAMPFYRIFLFISVFVFIKRARFIASSHIIVFAALLYLSLSSRRHIPLYAFATAPYIAMYMQGIELPKAYAAAKRILTQLAGAALGLYMILFIASVFSGEYYIRIGTNQRFGLGRVGYPDKAADFLLHAGVTGNIFNDYGSGCFLIWKLYPHKKVFLDGRNTIYGEKFIKEKYISPLKDPVLFEALAREYNINCIFLCYGSGLENITTILPYLHKSENWTLVFFDARACIFVRNTQENSGIIRRHKVDIAKTKDSAGPLTENWKSVRIRDSMNKAAYYEVIGLLDMSIDTLKDAIAVAPLAGDLHYNLGSVYLKKDMLFDAARELKTAININVFDMDSYNNLGIAYARSGQYKQALWAFKKALMLNPLHKDARRNIKMAGKDYQAQKKNKGIE